MTARLAVVIALAALVACGERAASPVADEVAGQVVELRGAAQAERPGAAARALAVGASLWRDDTLTTSADASITVELVHNGARWSLGGGQQRRLDASLAWAAPRGSASGGPEEPIGTAAAGRHVERPAAETAGTVIENAGGAEIAPVAPKIPAGGQNAKPEPGKPSDDPKVSPIVAPGPPVVAPAAPSIAPPPPDGPTAAAGTDKIEIEVASIGTHGSGLEAGGSGSGAGGSGVGTLGHGSGSGVGGGEPALPRPPAGAKVNRVVARGVLPREIAARVARHHQAELGVCLAGQGGLSLVLAVDKTGHVASSAAKPRAGASDQAARCAERRARDWRFPSAQGTTQITIDVAAP